MEKKKFYLTTAIAYTSRKPHIGNTYDVVLADMIARYKRMMGFDVFFLTGSDEHGQKIEDCAREQGISPKAYVDGVSEQIRAVWDCLNTTYDKFIRTTDGYPEKVVQKKARRRMMGESTAISTHPTAFRLFSLARIDAAALSTRAGAAIILRLL